MDHSNTNTLNNDLFDEPETESPFDFENEEEALFATAQEKPERTFEEEVELQLRKDFNLSKVFRNGSMVFPYTFRRINGVFEISYIFGNRTVNDKITNNNVKNNLEFFNHHFTYNQKAHENSIKLGQKKQKIEFYTFNFKTFRDTLKNVIVKRHQNGEENIWKNLKPSQIMEQ